MSNQITHKSSTFHISGPPKSKTGIIVIQEWWGITPHILSLLQRFSSSLSALCITPDLYNGKVAQGADEASHLMHNLDWEKACETVLNGADYLRSQGCTRVGVVGFCMGGALTIASCARGKGMIDAGVCFYGIPPSTLAEPIKINVPMQYHFGNQDTSKGFSSKEDADLLKQKLIDAGKDVSEFFQYDADHAFMNEDSPAYPFNEQVSKIAMENTIRFFKKMST